MIHTNRNHHKINNFCMIKKKKKTIFKKATFIRLYFTTSHTIHVLLKNHVVNDEDIIILPERIENK